MASSEAPPSSSRETPTINSSTKTKSKMIRNDLLPVDSAFAEANKYMDHMNVKINQAHEKFEELQTLGGSQGDFDELRKDVMKLKLQIPSHVKFRSSNSNPHRKRWPNINEAEDGMTHFFYKEPQVLHNDYLGGQFKASFELSEPLLFGLLCFFAFPPEATIKKRTMIYLWIGQGLILWHLRSRGLCQRDFDAIIPHIIEEDVGNEIFDALIAKGFIEPVYQNCPLVPDTCRMSLSVRSSFYKEAKFRRFTSNDSLDLDPGFVCSGLKVRPCLINVGEAIINCRPEIFENIKFIRSLYLGRWQSSATHHIELADAKILHGLKNLCWLEFLSL
ncbi:hypothetical protein RHMOL_Rhmol03G0021500 [Rhododendron molle]|uniref:Uncharacterized protein n=1 Tax=Rhododendron molle TaxID=49168 RepID=A0ACC0PAT7_RHOML|nr:hypothetical protein RHMOL_Rhmol03G0021500 [Rhododendron molle]